MPDIDYKAQLGQRLGNFLSSEVRFEEGALICSFVIDTHLNQDTLEQLKGLAKTVPNCGTVTKTRTMKSGSQRICTLKLSFSHGNRGLANIASYRFRDRAQKLFDENTAPSSSTRSAQQSYSNTSPAQASFPR